MAADIFTLRTALAPGSDEARRAAMHLHPSTFKRIEAGESAARVHAEQLAIRFESWYEQLADQGLPDGVARTEVARLATRQVLDGFAARLRHHRAAGQQGDANVLVVALSSLQGLVRPLAHHSGDVHYARRAVSMARGRLRHNDGLLHRLHPHGNPAFGEADATLEALEIFLAGPEQKPA